MLSAADKNKINFYLGGVCNANCHTVTKLKKTVDELTEKVRSLATAIKVTQHVLYHLSIFMFVFMYLN